MASRKVFKKAKSARTKKKVAKAPAKKRALKKAIPRKSVTKKAVSKTTRSVPKKTAPKKKTATAMKSTLQKDLSKRPVGRLVPRIRKPGITEPVKPVSQPVDTPATEPVTNESEQNISHTEDPMEAVDQKAFDKITVKGDPHQKLQLSSRRKSTIKPAGKKPLWN